MLPGSWRDPIRTAKMVIVVAAALIILLEIWIVCRPVNGLPRTPLRADSFLIHGLDEGHRISQTMRVASGGFDQIVLRASPFGEIHRGYVVLELYESEAGTITGEQRFLYRNIVPVSVFISDQVFSFRFPEIKESAGHWYRLDVWMADRNVRSGVGLWATNGRWSEGGSMFINDQAAYAELVFEAQATRRATSLLALWHHFSEVGLAVFLILAVCVHVAFFRVVYVLAMLQQSEVNDAGL